MHFFGSECCAYLQEKMRLDWRAKKGRFVGYDYRSPAYMVYIPETQDIRPVRSVEFFENDTDKDDDATYQPIIALRGPGTVDKETGEVAVPADCCADQPASGGGVDAAGDGRVATGGGAGVTGDGVEAAPFVAQEKRAATEASARYPGRQRRSPRYLGDHRSPTPRYILSGSNIFTP